MNKLVLVGKAGGKPVKNTGSESLSRLQGAHVGGMVNCFEGS